MEHKDCGGKVVENLLEKDATMQLKCLKCGKTWSILSDLSDITEADVHRGRLNRLPFFEFNRFWLRARVPSVAINFLFNDRLRHVIQMMDFSLDRESIGLDIGCSKGYLTRYLAYRSSGLMVGIDVSKNDLYRGKIMARLRTYLGKSISRGTVELIRADITHSPFRKGSIDVVVCASVLEHISDLEGAIKEIEDLMRKNGILIAAYPIETSLFITLLRLFAPVGLRIRDPRIYGRERFERSPDTHKQSFIAIRNLLQKYFIRMRREKSFFTILPDQVSWYECVKMMKKQTLRRNE